MVVIEMPYDTLDVWANLLGDIAKLAPNCIINEILPAKDYWEVVVFGPKMECVALAEYFNDLTGGDEFTVQPFLQRNRRY